MKKSVFYTCPLLLMFILNTQGAYAKVPEVPPIVEPQEKVLTLKNMKSFSFGPGVNIKVVTGGAAQMAFISSEKDSVVAPHNHPEEQITFVKKGKVKFIVNGREHILMENDMIVVPSYMVHSSVALEYSETVETFGPFRAGWKAVSE